MKGLINSVAYADGLRVGEVAIPDISEVLREPGRFVWVGLHEPDDEMLAEIQQEFSLHDLAVEDAAHAHQRPKLERYGNSIFVVLRTVHIDQATAGSTTARRTSSWARITSSPSGTAGRCRTATCARAARPLPIC